MYSVIMNLNLFMSEAKFKTINSEYASTVATGAVYKRKRGLHGPITPMSLREHVFQMSNTDPTVLKFANFLLFPYSYALCH